MKDKQNNNKQKEISKIIENSEQKKEIKENYKIGIEYYEDIEKHQS